MPWQNRISVKPKAYSSSLLPAGFFCDVLRSSERQLQLAKKQDGNSDSSFILVFLSDTSIFAFLKLILMSKAVIITGAAGNLGSAVTAKFLAEGYQVVAIVEPRTRHHFPETPNLDVKEANLFDEDAARVAVQQAYDQFPTLQAGALLVGGFMMGNLIRTSYRELEQMMDLNFKSAYNVVRPLFLRMQSQGKGGRIVLIGARPVLEPGGGVDMIGYALSKSLIFKLADLLNAAGADKDIVTSVVVPSIIDTPTNRSAMPDADFSTWVKPDELAEKIENACHLDKRPAETIIKVYG